MTAICEGGIASGERTIHSPWLGDVEAGPESEILFPLGLPGFEDEHRMVPVEIPAQRPIVYLQSARTPPVCFMALPVYVIDAGFQLRLSEEERWALELPEDRAPVIGEDVLCLALLVPCEGGVQANLSCSIVINLHNRRGVQCIPEAGSSGCFRLSAGNGWTALC